MRGALLLLSALALAGCGAPRVETREETSRLIVMVGVDAPGLAGGGPDDALFERHYADRPLARLAELLETTARPFLGYLRLRRVDERLWDVLRAAGADGSTLTVVTRERLEELRTLGYIQ